MSEFADKVRSIGVSTKRGMTETTIIPREDKPGIAGKKIEHWDGRVDAVATPDTAKITLTLES